VLVALGTIASQQSKGTQATAQALAHLINYAVAHPDATVRYHASNMYLHLLSDASYLSEASARSRAGDIFFLSQRPTGPSKPPAPTVIPPSQNGAIHIISTIMRNVMASTTEAELGALSPMHEMAYLSAPLSSKWATIRQQHRFRQTMRVLPASPMKW
jgi:hypothetical protein